MSETGPVRDRNEDRFALVPETAGYVLCDGMGGHPGGARAAELACSAAAAALGGRDIGTDGVEAVAQAARAAIDAVADGAAAEPAYRDMGTTLTLAWLGARDGQVRYGQIGDSRLYRLTATDLIQVTDDHTIGAEMVRLGVLDAEAAPHSVGWHALTRAVGGSGNHVPDIGGFDAAGTEAILLCSDGVTNMIDDRTIAGILRHHAGDAEAACCGVVMAALAAGGHDNATAIVLMPGG